MTTTTFDHLRAFRTKEAWERLGISKSTFWNRVKDGEIRTVKIGGTTVVTASEMDRILAGDKIAA